MARFGQLTHLPDCLAAWVILRRRFRWYSFRYGVWLLLSSYSLRSSGVFLTLVLAAFLAGVVLVDFLSFGGVGGVTFLGLLGCLLSPDLSRIGVDAGLLRGSYSAPNLLGSGTVMAKVMPTARLGGGTPCGVIFSIGLLDVRATS